MASGLMRRKSDGRAHGLAEANKVRPAYCNGVLLGNWVEERVECPKTDTIYFPPEDKIDYNKMKPEFRQADFKKNKLNSLEGTLASILRHDSHDACGNYTSTNDLVYRHLPKPLCGPELRHFRKAEHIFHPQPDLMKCFGNITEWGLRKYMEHEWACNNVSDYWSTLYEDTYVAPNPDQYLHFCERKARNSSFTKTFQFSMMKPVHGKSKRGKK